MRNRRKFYELTVRQVGTIWLRDDRKPGVFIRSFPRVRVRGRQLRMITPNLGAPSARVMLKSHPVTLCRN
jgi:hypothetical protein